jgi:hypothetical protein
MKTNYTFFMTNFGCMHKEIFQLFVMLFSYSGVSMLVTSSQFLMQSHGAASDVAVTAA